MPLGGYPPTFAVSTNTCNAIGNSYCQAVLNAKPKHQTSLTRNSTQPIISKLTLTLKTFMPQPTTITYRKGDATSPQAKGQKIIAHICNDLGGWGKGFVLALSKRWPAPEAAYRRWHRERATNDFGLGAVQLVPADRFVDVANMVAQRGIKTGSAGSPIRYEALKTCLEKLAVMSVAREASVHMPRIGCGLAGGKWERVEPLIAETLLAAGGGGFCL